MFALHFSPALFCAHFVSVFYFRHLKKHGKRRVNMPSTPLTCFKRRIMKSSTCELRNLLMTWVFSHLTCCIYLGLRLTSSESIPLARARTQVASIDWQKVMQFGLVCVVFVLFSFLYFYHVGFRDVLYYLLYVFAVVTLCCLLTGNTTTHDLISFAYCVPSVSAKWTVQISCWATVSC